MASVTITVPDNKANKVYDAFNNTYHHVDGNGDPVENPTAQEKIAFVKSKLVDYLKEVVFADDVNTAISDAREGTTKDETVAS